ncbi:MAG: UbiX family flavin prenyltransferase [Chloroflexota bacterium]
MARRIVVGISGSTGAIYGARLVEILHGLQDVETHLVMSSGARTTIQYELERDPDEIAAQADVVYDERNVGAAIASGSFLTSGMIVAPCSIRSVSAIANSLNDNLLTRAADVCLKERRRLVLIARETPLHAGHLRLMLDCTNAGAVILPPSPAFYHRPKTIMDIVDQTLGKALDLFGIDAGLFERWNGLSPA